MAAERAISGTFILKPQADAKRASKRQDRASEEAKKTKTGFFITEKDEVILLGPLNVILLH